MAASASWVRSVLRLTPSGLERRVVVHVRERLGTQTQLLVESKIFLGEHSGLIEEAEIRPLHIEADGGHRPFMRRKRLENARQQELDRARLGRKAGDTRDVEMGSLRSEQKVTIEVHRGLEASGGVESHRYAGGPRAGHIRIHAQASRTSASDASHTPPSGTGWSGSSGICRSTAAVKSRISDR